MKSTKKSLLLSTISLVLCFAMLLGTTWAWFTDEVTSGVNQIKAGNLDVELYHATSDAVTADDDHKVTSTTQLFNIEHWEPGMVAYENFMVKNVGNLALKYQLAMTVGDFNKTVDGNHTLKEVLKVAVVPGGFTGTTRAEAEALDYTSLDEFSVSSEKSLLPNTEGEKFGVVIYWKPTDNDNLYNLNNGKKAVASNKFGTTELGIELGIKLLASQLEHEYDSFGKDYDGEASYSETVAATIEAGKDTVFYSAVTPSNENGNQTKVTFPKEIKAFADKTGKETTMTVEATPTVAANHKFTVSSNNNGSVGAIDLTVKVDGTEVTEFKDGSEQPVEVTVETYIAKGLTLNDQTNTVSVVYEGESDQPTFVSYESATGKLVFKTKHFSTFLIDADQVAYVESNNTAYKDFNDAMSACKSNDTIYMLKNYKYESSPSYVYNNTIAKYTIDLNGYTLDFNNSSYGLYVLKNQTVTINDSVGTGALKNKQCVVYVGDGAKLIVNGGHLYGVDSDSATIYGYGDVTVNGGVVDVAKHIEKYGDNDLYGVFFGNHSNDNTPAKFTMNGGEVYGGLYINGQDTEQNILTITGGILGEGNYLAGVCQANISGGTFLANNCAALYWKQGNPLTISGGTFDITIDDECENDWAHYDNGCILSNAAIIIEACNYGGNGNPTAVIGENVKFNITDNGSTVPFYDILVINYGYNGDTPNKVNCDGIAVPYALVNKGNAVDQNGQVTGHVTNDGDSAPGDGWLTINDDCVSIIDPSAD